MNKPKIDFRLEAKADPLSDTAKVYMYGDIVDEHPKDWWTGELLEGDFITPKGVRDLIDGVEEKHIELHINSYGGSVFASVSILNYLNTIDKTINVIIDGVAASGASIIAMAGDKILMPRNTMMMIHRASTVAWGNASVLREVADLLDKIDDATVIENYRNRFTGSDEELIELVEAETWLKASEAYDYGLCDEIIELKDKPDEEKPENSLDDRLDFQNAIELMSAFGQMKLGGKNEEF